MPKRKTAETMPTASNGNGNTLAPVANNGRSKRALATAPPDKLVGIRALQAIGLEDILDKVRCGKTQEEIAKACGVSVSSLLRFLNATASAEEVIRARADSAEAWADRAWECLQLEEDEIDAARVNLARFKEAHCMKRAGIANPRYSDKQQVELTGANGGPVQSLVTVYVPANGREERIINDE